MTKNPDDVPIAFAYARASVVDLEQPGLSVPAQTTKLRQYCEWKGLRLMRVFSDENVSGRVPIAQRPSGGELMRQLRHDDARGVHVVFARLDRAFRSALDALAVVQDLTSRGVHVHFCDIGADTRTNEGRLVIGVLASVAEFERQRIAERTREAAHERRRRGLCTGGIPLGYKRDSEGSEVLVEDPVGMATLGRISELRDQGESMTTMQRILEDEHRLTAKGRRSWQRSSIKAALDRLKADSSLVLAGRRYLRDERERAAGYLRIEAEA